MSAVGLVLGYVTSRKNRHGSVFNQRERATT